MARNSVVIFEGRDFGMVHDIDENPNTINFQLHNHDDLYEIILFLNGDCEFCVEGNNYRLSPRDILFTRPFEMHHIVCLTAKAYERMILYIKTDYFKKYHCEEFLDIFENRQLGMGNCIPREIAERALKDCMTRLYSYCEREAYDVVEHAIIEFLYLINHCKKSTADVYIKDERVRNIILYINEHLSDPLNLDTLAQRFFLSKYSLCRIFKNNTGYTVNQYITYKRVMLAQELHKNGQTFMQASLNAGFNSYANFYKSYIKHTGKSPREMS